MSRRRESGAKTEGWVKVSLCRTAEFDPARVCAPGAGLIRKMSMGSAHDEYSPSRHAADGVSNSFANWTKIADSILVIKF